MASAAEKLLEQMRRSKRGWGFQDLERLYVGFGFTFRDKGKHRVYTHPRYPQLMGTVARHRTLAIGYVQHAISLIDGLRNLEAGQGGEDAGGGEHPSRD